MPKRQIIKLAKRDIDKAVIRGLKGSAWQAKSAGTTKERVHLNAKLKQPRHKENLVALAEASPSSR
ncbi:MAG: hypothetical protein WC453_03340 [Patescibacteria group bacterium]